MMLTLTSKSRLNESPELIAQEFCASPANIHVTTSLNESPELIAQESSPAAR